MPRDARRPPASMTGRQPKRFTHTLQSGPGGGGQRAGPGLSLPGAPCPSSADRPGAQDVSRAQTPSQAKHGLQQNAPGLVSFLFALFRRRDPTVRKGPFQSLVLWDHVQLCRYSLSSDRSYKDLACAGFGPMESHGFGAERGPPGPAHLPPPGLLACVRLLTRTEHGELQRWPLGVTAPHLSRTAWPAGWRRSRPCHCSRSQTHA